VLFLTEPYGGVEVQLHAFFELGTRWRWVVSFTPRPLYPQEKSLWYHWIGGWVGLRAVLDEVVKRKIHSPRRESNPRTQIIQAVAQHYTDWAVTSILILSSRLLPGIRNVLFYPTFLNVIFLEKKIHYEIKSKQLCHQENLQWLVCS
jgi:hypothetical protein